MAARYRLTTSAQAWASTTYWSATLGGAGGASVPLTGDTATFPTVTAASSITLTGTVASPNTLTALSPSAPNAWTLNGGNLSFDVSTQVDVQGSAPTTQADRGFWFGTTKLVGTSVLTKTGVGVLAVGGGASQAVNTYSGGTVVNGGWIEPVFAFAGTGGAGHFGTGTITFASTGGTVGIVTGATSVTYTIPNQLIAQTGFSIGLVNTEPSLTFSGGISFSNAGNTTTITVTSPATVSGAVTGDSTNTFAKAGVGTLTLSSANTFQGTVRTTAGTLAFTNIAGLQDAIFEPGAGGTTTFVSGSSIGGLTGSGAFTLPAGTTQIGGVGVAVTATYTGALGGTTQAILKVNSGTQTLGGVSTRTTGTTQINAGAIQLTNGNGLYGATGSGATAVQGGGLWLSNNITTPSTAPLTLQGNDTGTSSGLRSLSGSNTYAGTVTFNSLVPGSPVSVYADAGATLTLSNAITLTSTAVFSGPGTIVVSGALGSTGAVTKSDAGLMRVTGASTKTAGAWTLNGGETRLETANALGAAGSSIAVATVAAGAKLYVVGAITIPANKTISALAGTLGATTTGGGTWAGAVVVSATGATIENNTAAAFTVSGGITPASSGLTLAYDGTGNITQSGVIGGTLAVTKNGIGTTTFAAASTYSGVTTLAAGIANVGIAENAGTNGPFGDPLVTNDSLLMTGGTLQYSSANVYDYSDRFATTGGQQWNIDTNGQNVTFNLTSLAGASSLTKLGSGTLTLGALNTFSGNLTASAGTVSATNTRALGLTTSVRTIAVTSSAALSIGIAGMTYSTASLNLAGTGVSSAGALIIANTGTSTFATTLTASALVRFTSAGILAGTIATAGFDLTVAGSAGGFVTAVVSGTGKLIVGTSGNTSSVSLQGTNTYTGNTDVSFANLLLSGAGSLGSGSYAKDISIASGLTLSHAGATQTLSGVISGDGAVTKLGSNTLTLSGANTYTGKTTVGALGIISFNTIGNVNGGASALGNPAVGNGTIAVGSTTSSGTLVYTGSGSSTDRVIDLAGSTGGTTITNNGSGTLTFTAPAWTATGNGIKAITFSGSAPITVQSTIVDSTSATSVTHQNSTTLTLSGASTYTGTTTVSNSTGTLDISAGNNRLATTSKLTLSTGTIALGTANQTVSTLTLGAGSASSAITGSGTLTATTMTISATGGTWTVATPLSVSGTTTKSGSSDLVLNGNNSFGRVDITAGTATFSGNNTFTDSTFAIGGASNTAVTFSGTNTWTYGLQTVPSANSTATINYNSAANFSGMSGFLFGFSGAGGNVVFNGTGESVTLSQTLYFIATLTKILLPTSNSSLTLSGVLSSSGLVQIGDVNTTVGANSVVRFSNTGNTFSNGTLTVRNGALYVTDVRQLGGSKIIVIAASGTGAASLVLDGTSGNITIPSSTFPSLTTSSGTGVSPQPTYFGVVNVAGNNVIQSNIVTAAGGGDSYFTVNGGTLTLSGNVSSGGASVKMQLNGTGSGTVSGTIGSGGVPAVRVSGSSTWTLSGANAYAGGTTTADTATVIAGSTTALGVGNVTLGAGTSIKTLTAGGQNGKLTITGTFNNSAGATIYIGG